MISDLGSSARMHEREPLKRAAQLDEAYRFIDLAHNLSAPWIRVSGCVFSGRTARDTQKRIGETLAELGTFARGSGVGVLMESHGALTDSASLVSIMKAAVKDERRAGGTRTTRWSKVTEACRHLGSARPMGASPTLKDRSRKAMIAITSCWDRAPLVSRQSSRHWWGGYDGFFGFEWEKAWHPDIDEP